MRPKQPKVSNDISQSLGKLPPQELDIEAAVLGAIILEKKAIIEVASILRVNHFYSEAHQEIYRAIIEMFAAGESIDMLTLTGHIRSNGKLEIIGGAYYIAELTSRVSSAANIEFHARLLVEAGMKRSLIKMASDIHQEAYEDTTDVFSLIEKSNLEIQEIFDDAIGSRAEQSMVEIGLKVIRTIEARQSGKHTGLDSGFAVLDSLLNGFHKTDLIILAARPGMGKAQSLDENLLSINGWIKMRDVKNGDMLAGSDGKFYPVTGVFPQGKRKTCKVIFDDGSDVICDYEHLWYTQTRADRKTKGGRTGTVKKTSDIKETLQKGVRKNHSIPFVKPIQFKDRKTKINPYLYGVLVGDGGLTGATVRLSNPEKDVVIRCSSLLPDGYQLNSSSSLDHSIVRTKNEKKSFFHLIPELKGKHSYEKLIDEVYLLNSVENRVLLLRGLLDTDGHVCNKSCPWIEYSTTSGRLAEQVVDLVRGLGGRATCKKYQGKYTKNGEKINVREYFRIMIAFSNGIIPVSTVKHLSRYKHKRYSQKFITDIIDHETIETQCISIGSPDSLYVTSGHTLTHNTSFAMQAGKNIAEKGVPVGIFSLEMSNEQLVERLAISESEIDSDRVKKGLLDSYEVTRYMNAVGKLSKLPIFIDDTPFMTILELRARAMRMKTKHKIQFIIVDYLQLIKGINEGGKTMNRDQEIGVITRTLKGIAKELDIPIVALAQLSRAVETRGGLKKPQLSDLRESGSIEQDADVVLFLYRPEYYKITEDQDGFPTHGLCEVIVEKHRNGSTGTVKVKFIGKLTKFAPWETEYIPTVKRQEHATNHYKDPTKELKPQSDDEPF